MNIKNYLESTILSPIATKKEIIELCKHAEKNKLLGICVHPYYVPLAKKVLAPNTEVKIVTVVGFPLGQNTTSAKMYETLNAVKDGALEIDMVLNIAKFKEGDLQYCIDEINAVKKAASIRPLKVIVETALLSVEELVTVCEMIKVTKADFIKTSTGFSHSGAEVETIKMWRSILNGEKGIKASGGISNYRDAKAFVEAGADRIGTSKASLILDEEKTWSKAKDDETMIIEKMCKCGNLQLITVSKKSQERKLKNKKNKAKAKKAKK